MRSVISGLLLLCGAPFALATVPGVTEGPVHLDTPQDLARLAATNPGHYARARRLIASDNTLCRPGRPKLENTDARGISCTLLLLTSNPPKRELSFTLDRISYVALVTLTADRPRPVPAQHQP